MKLLWFVIATCLCFSSSSGGFSADLETVVEAGKVTAADTTRIVGPNVYCITVSDPGYYNGVPVIAARCGTSPGSAVTEFWTIGTDGTIKSNGKCLMPYADSAGAYIMIYNCPNPINDIAKWKLGDSGKFSSKSGLVLTYNGTGLILDIDVSSSYQTWWILSTYNKPRLMMLLFGMTPECMTLSGSTEVLIKTCDLSNSAQKWYDFPDGTIRPGKNIDRCVSYADPFNNRLVVVSCGLNPSSQRWYFRGKSSKIVIFNERARLAMERTQDNKIYAYPFNGRDTQEWGTLDL